MKLSRGVVGGDTGLLHLAVAMGKRVAMLMGAADAGVSCPFGHPEWALLPPEGQPVVSIPVEAVLRRCAEAFASCAG